MLPPAALTIVVLYGLNTYAEAGMTAKAPPFTLIFTLPPSKPNSVAT